ncbi:TBCC-domain-containing protein [Dissoconium aciculare CBS 342.82]|uniref:TBCC-domain-containing protein n=1 Tax=Dissoconium aciculare CBS 342.82 TaxID=1314786 RepID=A0A6J3MBN1_9PEZI|nr:TBCC-domain-containing protein [Dissoconium aciculare CBS 342.82]KAF1825034.1 TBCC-domain-containing protein [Dissoconium aciculare CBS 342.82]
MAGSTTPSAANASEQFFHYFQHEVADLRQEIDKLETRGTSGGERQDAVDHCLSSIARLSNEVNDISSSTPARDQKTYAEAIKALNSRLQDARSAFAPRPKFAFKSGLKFSEKKNALEPALTGTTTRVKQQQQSLPKDTGTVGNISGSSNHNRLELAGYDNAHLTVPSDEVHSSGTVAKIRSSIIDLSKRDHKITQPLAALTLKDIRKSLVICGNVAGAIHLTDIHDSVIVLQSRQFRMHDSTNCHIYLQTSSRPIIEDCNGLKFAPAPEWYLDDAKTNNTGEATIDGGMWANVDDFKWLKPEPSPNWSRLPSEKRVSPNSWETLFASDDEPSKVLQRVGVSV